MEKIRIQPIISEKSTKLAGLGWYSFLVSKRLGKKRAADLIGKNFKVKVISINSMVKRSKPRRTGKTQAKTQELKKILVRLKKGQKIEIFEVET